MMTIDELIEHAITHARHVLIGKPDAELMPSWLIQSKERVTIVGTPFDGDMSKDFVAAAIRQILKKEKADSYSFMSEAWMSHQEVGEPYLEPRKSDKRREIVMVTACNRKGECKLRTFETMRGADGAVIALEPIKASGKDDHFQGRFYNLFD